MAIPRSLFAPRFRFFRNFGYTLIALVVLTALAPIIVAKTPLSTWLIGQATRDLPINVTVGSLWLNWFSPIVASDVVIHDSEGKPLAQIPRLASEQNLVNLVLYRKEIGKIRVERANVDIVFANNTSNIETILSKLPKAEAKPAKLPTRGGPPAATFAIECIDGVARVVDSDKNKTWQLAKLELRLAHDPKTAPPLTGTLAASVTGDGEPGSLDLKIEGDMIGAVKGTLTGKGQALPFGLAAPFLRRSYPDATCAGRLQADAYAKWYLAQDGTPVFLVNTKFDSDRLEVSGGPFGDDRVVVKALKIPFMKMEHTGSYLAFECSDDASCDLGSAKAKGKITFSRTLLASLSDPGTVMTAKLDLAKIAEAMPKTLNLHKDVRVTAGRIDFEGKSQPTPNGHLVDMRLVTSAIHGTRGASGNTNISWPNPLDLSFQLRPGAKSFSDIEKINCKSRFMTIVGEAQNSKITLFGNVDLGELTPTLGQFVDVGAWGLGGRAGGTVNMAWPDKNSVSVKADIRLDQFQWGQWREPQLRLDAEIQSVNENGQQRIDKSSKFRIETPADVLDIQLREPIVLSNQGQTGSVYAELNGDLGRWQQRLKPFTSALDDVSLQGQSKVQVAAVLTAKRIDVRSLTVSSKDLKLKTAGMNIQDPGVELQTALAYNIDQGSLEFKNTKLVGHSLTLSTNKLSVDLKRRAMLGSVDFSGELGLLYGWFGAPKPGSDVWTGAIKGQAELQSGDESFDIDIKSTIKDVAFGPPKKSRFSDPLMQVRTKGNFAGKKGTLRLDKIQVNGQLGALEAKGKITKFDTTMDLDVAGALAYDMASIEPLLKSYLGESARIQGKDQRDFRLAGPLRPKGTAPGAAIEWAALQGNAGMSWQSILGYGAEVGPADLKAHLQGGWIKVDPIVTSLNQGKLTLTPSFRFDPAHELVLPSGPVIENAKITPAMCASGLGYAAPLLANVASVDGELSLRLDSARVPLGEADKTDLQGTLLLHHAKVGPGPLIAELLSVLTTAAPVSIIRENQVKVKIEKGRVYHENFELLLPDNATLRTSGSVGFDGTLAMVAEVPLPAKLIGNLKLPANIAGTPVRLPITGTINSPRIDTSALKTAIRDVPGDLIRKGIDSQLKKLFK
jgi:translocation and assembly module TamB